ncbi:ATP-binding cassette domain-containing protein, partial [Oscillospiraceae bacterium OttesenSCG-928-F05]|nr:ATP-binding cassette domain-containing protein [Oscillospiraceae bacterium OttesenSCG-928-F05]
MIEIGVHAVHKSFGFKAILSGINFEINTRERAAIVGRNGTGKTTILKMIAGQESPDHGEVFLRRGATVGFLEQLTESWDNDTTVHNMLYQSFSSMMAIEEQMRVLETAMELDNADNIERLMCKYSALQDQYIALDGYAKGERIEKIVSRFSLEPLLQQSFSSLSGGQKTLVSLAAILLREPDILILDEPTNHLDLKMLRWLEDYLSHYRGTVLIVSHDRQFLDRVVTKTILLERGLCTMHKGNYSFALKEQERMLMLEFEKYKTQQKKISEMKATIKRYRDWGQQGDNEKFFIKA